jgi:hypothetical protein
MESNNQTYPIDIDTSLEKAFYRENSFDDLKLTAEQRIKLERFIEIFLSDNKYIDELKAQSKTDTFSINNFIIEYNPFEKEDNIVVSIVFYSEHKIWEVWQLDKENNIWWTHNIGYYKFSDDNIELMGWGY